MSNYFSSKFINKHIPIMIFKFKITEIKDTYLEGYYKEFYKIIVNEFENIDLSKYKLDSYFSINEKI